MNAAQQETVNELGRDFGDTFAAWIERHRAGPLAALNMAEGSVEGIVTGMKQTLVTALVTVLDQQANTGPAKPADATPPVAPDHVVVSERSKSA